MSFSYELVEKRLVAIGCGVAAEKIGVKNDLDLFPNIVIWHKLQLLKKKLHIPTFIQCVTNVRCSPRVIRIVTGTLNREYEFEQCTSGYKKIDAFFSTELRDLVYTSQASHAEQKSIKVTKCQIIS
jgi:hypothetical protein